MTWNAHFLEEAGSPVAIAAAAAAAEEGEDDEEEEEETVWPIAAMEKIVGE